MSATAPRRFRKGISVGVTAAMLAATALVFSAAPASAAAPAIVNAGVSPGAGGLPNWLEGNAVTRNSKGGATTQDDAKIFSTFVVKHDEGRTVTGIAIDQDWLGTDETSTVVPNSVTPTVIPGSTSNYSTVRFSFEPNNHPDARTDPVLSFCGGNNSNPSGPIRFRAVLDDGTRSAPVSFTISQLMELGCTGVNNAPVIYNQTQTATSVVPGTTVGFTFQGDDSDAPLIPALSSNDAFDKIRWRVRRLNDGAIVQGPTCQDVAGSNGQDNITVSLSVNFTAAFGRGRYVVETEAGGESDTINNTSTTTCAASNINGGGRFFRIGAVDVQSAPAATTLSLSAPPALVQAGTNYTLTATAADSDTTGRIQVVEWDADGTPGFERRILSDEATGVVAADKQQLVTTTVGQCADRTVNVQVTDNGSMNASDANRVQKTASASTVVNCAPVANDQSVAATEDTPASFTIAPTDGDGDPLTYSVVTPAAHGVISGTYPNFVYNPATNFNGTDFYIYKVDDGKAANDTAKVTFNVAKANDKPVADDFSVNTNEDTPIVINVDPHVSDNDEADTPPQTLTVSIVTGPATGVATVTGPTQITYTPNPPANFNGVVSLVYRVDDGQGAPNSTDDGTLTINVDPVDDAPVADDQLISTPEDTSKTLTLGPTTDVDDESVTYSVPPALQPTHGSVSVAGTAATYTPAPDYFGPDEFMFQATDGNSVTTGTITVDVTPVNDAPVAQSQDVSTLEDTALPITLTATDVDNTPDQLTFLVIAPPTHGQLDTINGTSLVYTPDLNYNGPDSLTFLVTDLGGLTSTASVSITVIPVNDPPVADDGAAVTDEDNPVPVLLTASDVDNTQDQLTYTITVPPQYGTLTGTNSNLVYTPNLNYNGPDSFQFQVSDGDLTDEGQVLLTVNATNDPPEAIPQAVATNEDTPLAIALDATDVDDATANLTFQVISGPSHGTLDTTTGQALNYTPTLDYNGYDALVFKVTDPSGTSDVATVIISVGDVGTNDPPLADDQAVTTDEDTDVPIVLTGTDVDGDALTYSIEVAPDHGIATILNDSVIYSPSLNYHGSDLIVFKVDDGHGGVGFGSVNLTVTSVNDAPDAIPATVQLLEDTPTPITLTGADVDGDTLSYSITNPPDHGTLTGTAPNVTYKPATDYYGNDEFEFTVNDGHGGITTGTISLIVDAAPKQQTKMFAEGVIATILHGGPTLLVSIPVTAHLTDRVTGHGIAGKTVSFTMGNGTLIYLCNAVTDSTGTATCTAVISTVRAVLALGYTAYFAGDEDTLAASDAGPLIRLFNLNIL